MAFHEKGGLDQAIADFTDAIRLDPEIADAYYNRGHAYGRRATSTRPIADLTQAIRFDPENSEYGIRGLAYGGRGNSTTPSPTSPKRSGSTRNTPRPITTGVSPTISTATKPRPKRTLRGPSNSGMSRNDSPDAK